MSDQIMIYHNPRCSKSRAALQLMQDRGIDNPILIERAIVVADGKAMLGRPPEQILELL